MAYGYCDKSPQNGGLWAEFPQKLYSFAYLSPGAVLGNKYIGERAWTLIIWEATTVKRNYYRTNYIKHVEKLGLNYPEKNWGAWTRFGGLCPLAPT